ncbi:uncharacterized protein UBRO_21049 [Ustilago bromivora]|uniref:CCHC-type domain-containing protein n=1 Tax=Ustilago bromivora TaxID=307758 RepID=A0A1K0FXN1_9BASI|nr:uncharacterized protein UBRO_21049 [Ustilago bromivora]
MSPSASCWIISFSSELWLSYLESLRNGNQPRTGMPRDEVGDDTKAMGEAHPSEHKLPATPFPKFNPRDVEIFIIEAEAWFMFNRVYDHKSMIHHISSQLEATHHVKRFRDLEGQVNMEDKDLVIDLFRGSLTCSLQEKFECNPPTNIWEWYQEVEDIDCQQMLMQQSTSRHLGVPTPCPNPVVQSTPSTPLLNLRPQDTTPLGNNTCHWCKGTGHWARDCPSRKQPVSSTPRPSGPKVMVILEDTPEEEANHKEEGPTEEESHNPSTNDQEGSDLIQQPSIKDYGEDYDEDNEGNTSGTMH